MLIDLIKKSRTHRFYLDTKITDEEMLKILESVRFSPFSMNKQSFKIAYTIDKDKCLSIFKTLTLGAMIKEKATEDEMPSAYILICEDKDNKVNEKSFHFSLGLLSQNINLMANELGYSTCIVASYDKNKVSKIFGLDENIKSHYLIVLGRGKDEVVIKDVSYGEDLKYYRENGKHIVPKLRLEDLLLK